MTAVATKRELQKKLRDAQKAAAEAMQELYKKPENRDFFVEQGRKGGKLGGKKRAESMTPEQRRELALKAVRAREAKRRAAKRDAQK
jgi:hypothetical protein